VKDLIPWVWGRLPLTRRMRYLLVWLLNPKFTAGVVAIITNDEGEVLLVKHTYRGNKPWDLPGGGLKPRESIETCLRRELREETGLQIIVDRHLYTGVRTDRRHIEVVYACHLSPGTTLSDFRPSAEVAEARYFPVDSLPPGMYMVHRMLVQQEAGRNVKRKT
jgi:8-oxo-dGTP diphosphatase